MRLSRVQLEELYIAMDEVSQNSQKLEKVAKRSIRRTNIVIVLFTGLGAILAFLILSDFYLLNRAISRSINSMDIINKQVVELRGTMDDISSSIDNMGYNVEYLQRIGTSVNKIGNSTVKINSFMQVLNQQTQELGADAKNIGYYASTINQNFSQINNSVGNISFSVYQAVKPIKQFMPIP